MNHIKKKEICIETGENDYRGEKGTEKENMAIDY